MMRGIHILRGTGKNCTCGDCSVLYGGKCMTTKDNNFLDFLEKHVIKYLSKTPTGKSRKISDNHINMVIEKVVKPLFCKYKKIPHKDFYNHYWAFLPLVFLMICEKKDISYSYKHARIIAYWNIEKRYEL